MITKKFLLLLLCCCFVNCSKAENGGGGGAQPGINMEILNSGASSVTLSIQSVNTSFVRVLCVATNDVSARTKEQVLKDGTKYTGDKIVIEGLTKLTTYTVFAVACNDNGNVGSLQYVKFTTEADDPTMYAWEQSRSGVLSFSDMVLCYGGSTHRAPNYRWEKQRFAPFVTYTDKQGKEHWLFDSFLCIEFVLDNYSLNLGQHKVSAGREQWQKLIDYWFAANNGVNALEQAVADATKRIGAPSSKRKVIMTMPDPIIFKEYANMNSSTTYWGELNGRTVDFAQDKDRVAVYKWFIDQVRKRFDQGGYQNIELAGFYIVSEDLAIPGDGWNPELKRWENVIPAVAEYLHAINESLCWIPYNRAAGYKRWADFGIDYAYMQPNYFWDDKNEKPLSRFFSDIKSKNLAMEFEFDEALLEGKPNCDAFKRRFREYLSRAKSEGIYGKQPLSYYHGTNGFYQLWESTAAKDQELYHEFCQFVIGNPLRK